MLLKLNTFYVKYKKTQIVLFTSHNFSWLRFWYFLGCALESNHDEVLSRDIFHKNNVHALKLDKLIVDR